jgi:hypothetical protein
VLNLAEPVLTPDMFRANCNFIVDRLDPQGKHYIARAVLQISEKRSTLIPQVFQLAFPNTVIWQHELGLSF